MAMIAAAMAVKEARKETALRVPLAMADTPFVKVPKLLEGFLRSLF
jgi:hypothetical protein